MWWSKDSSKFDREIGFLVRIESTIEAVIWDWYGVAVWLSDLPDGVINRLFDSSSNQSHLEELLAATISDTDMGFDGSFWAASPVKYNKDPFVKVTFNVPDTSIKAGRLK